MATAVMDSRLSRRAADSRLCKITRRQKRVICPRRHLRPRPSILLSNWKSWRPCSRSLGLSPTGKSAMQSAAVRKISPIDEGMTPVAETRPNILIVDDRKENLLATEKVLRNLNAGIFKAMSGNEALSLML